MRVYLDVCSLNRPFDDRTQPRVHVEAEAVETIVDLIESGSWIGVGGAAVDFEIDRINDAVLRAKVRDVASVAKEFVYLNDAIGRRAMALRDAGFLVMDALHLACAEAAGVDVLLTTDDRFLRLARRQGGQLRVRVANPLAWLQEVWQHERTDDDPE